MRTATIRIRPADEALTSLRKGFLSAWKSGRYRGEFFDFESPAALFRVLTPKRWELIEVLQQQGESGVRALARALGRDVKRVHEDAQVLVDLGLLEKSAAGKLSVPFAEIHAGFVMKSAA